MLEIYGEFELKIFRSLRSSTLAIYTVNVEKNVLHVEISSGADKPIAYRSNLTLQYKRRVGCHQKKSLTTVVKADRYIRYHETYNFWNSE